MIAVETAVVGGGPAGAATACALAAAGREVVLIERASGAKPKVCGEFLSIDTQAHLARLGIDPVALGAVAVERVAIHSGTRSAGASLPFRALSLSRRRLDQALLQRAASVGAEVGRGVAVRAAELQARGWRLDCDDGRTVQCRALVAATGKVGLRGLVDRRDGSMIGLKIHLRPSGHLVRRLDRTIELYLWDGGYAGLALIEEETANLCLVLPRSAAAGLAAGFAPLRDYLASVAPLLAQSLADAVPLYDRPAAIVCPSGAHLHDRWHAGEPTVYRVGDRLAHIPPFTGDGIGIALCSAALAAEHIRHGISASAYAAAARRLIAPPLRLAGMMSWLAGNGFGRTLLTTAASRVPMFVKTVTQWTRVA